MGQKQKITLIGCGKMGSALLRGWLKSDLQADYIVVDPHGLPEEFQGYESVTYSKNSVGASNDIGQSDIVVVAVKPQVMDEVCEAVKPHISNNSLVLSIAAGRTIASFEEHFGTNQPVVRSMPNTPAAIGKGITVAVGNDHVESRQRELADHLLQSGGMVEWVSDEKYMNAVTGSSGSGPGYLFQFTEDLATAGVAAGLSEELAKKLARQTVIGAAALMESRPNDTVEVLREEVTSSKGTTLAGLEILWGKSGLKPLMIETVAAATRRGEEMSATAEQKASTAPAQEEPETTNGS